MKDPTPVEATINRQTKSFMTEIQLVDMFASGYFEYEFSAQIYNFFSDVTVPMMVKFLINNDISLDALKRYYELHIKEKSPNRQLEEVWS